MSQNDDTAEIQATLSATFRDGESDTIALRQVALGTEPLILIEIEASENSLHFDIDATRFDNGEELAEILETIVEILRDGSEA